MPLALPALTLAPRLPALMLALTLKLLPALTLAPRLPALMLALLQALTPHKLPEPAIRPTPFIM